MEKALINNAKFAVVQNGGTIAVAGATDVSFLTSGHNTFKLQGSSDGGATYGDIAGSAMTSDTTLALATKMSVWRSLFDHLKVVIDSGTCWIISRNLRTVPAGGATAFTKDAKTKLLVDPQLGTA